MSANNIWSSSSSTDGNLDANWSLGHVPTIGEVAYYDATSIIDCSFTTALTCNGLQTATGYTGTITFAAAGGTYNFGEPGMDLAVATLLNINNPINVTGDVIMNNLRTDMGTTTWTVSGNWDVTSISTFNHNNSTLIMNGGTAEAPKTIAGNLGYAKRLYNLTILGCVTTAGALSADTNILSVTGKFTVNHGTGFSDVRITGVGILTGSNLVVAYSISQFDATAEISVDTLNIKGDYIIAGGFYQCNTVFIYNAYPDIRSVLFTGDVIFTGNVTFSMIDTGTFIVDNSTNNPNLEFRGNVTFSTTGNGIFIWTKGTGIITLGDNPANGTQTINFLGKTVEDIVINAPGDTKQFTGGVTTDSFNAQNGTVDFNGQNIVIIGDFTMGTGSQVISDADAMNGVTLTVGGNFLVEGVLGVPITFNATAAWTLAVTGSAKAVYVTVAYSNASDSPVYAHYGVDNGDNSNWIFLTMIDEQINLIEVR